MFGNVFVVHAKKETAKNIKVALADGSVVDAGIDNEHSQLRWALAGSGGMNLAMALEFTFDLKQSLPRGYNFTRVEYRWNEDEEPADYEEEVYEVTKAWMLAVSEFLFHRVVVIIS